MPTLTKSGVARRVRDLLNHNGLHWIQGDYVGYNYIADKDKDVQAFCTMGGLQEIIFGNGNHVPREADEDPVLYALWQETAEEIAKVIHARHPGRYARLSSAADVVINWNDDERTDWQEVNAVLSLVALEKAKKATPPPPDPASIGL